MPVGTQSPRACLGPGPPASDCSCTCWAIHVLQWAPRPSLRNGTHRAHAPVWRAALAALMGLRAGVLSPVEWESTPEKGHQPPRGCVDSVASGTCGCPAGLSPLGSQRRRELTPLISSALSTVPKVSLLLVFITWVQPGVSLLVSMATPHRAWKIGK